MSIFSEETAIQVVFLCLKKKICLRYNLFLDLKTFCHSNPGTYGIVFIPQLVLPRYFCVKGIYVDFVDSKSVFLIDHFPVYYFRCKCIETIIRAVAPV